MSHGNGSTDDGTQSEGQDAEATSGRSTGGQGPPRADENQPGGQGQPANAQAQPAGGHPAGQAQPAAGQGQPAGRYQQGHGGVPCESVGDIFSKPSTMAQIKIAVGIYAAIGVGIGLSVFMLVDSFSSGVSSFGAIIGFVGVIAAAVVGPAIAGPIGLHVTDALSGIEMDQQIFATAGAGAFLGHIVMLIVASILVFAAASGGGSGGGDGGGLGEIFVPTIVGGIGAAIAAAGSSYAVRNFGLGRM